MNYREILGQFVEKRYVDQLDETGLEAAEEYSQHGGSPAICVAVGLVETEENDYTLEEAASELEVSRRGVYNARRELDLVDNESRGKHET